MLQVSCACKTTSELKAAESKYTIRYAHTQLTNLSVHWKRLDTRNYTCRTHTCESFFTQQQKYVPACSKLANSLISYRANMQTISLYKRSFDTDGLIRSHWSVSERLCLFWNTRITNIQWRLILIICRH